MCWADTPWICCINEMSHGPALLQEQVRWVWSLTMCLLRFLFTHSNRWISSSLPRPASDSMEPMSSCGVKGSCCLPGHTCKKGRTTSHGLVHDLTPVPVFVDFLGVRSCHVVPASLSFGTLLSFCGIHDFLALTDGHGSSLVSTDQVKAWGVVVVHLSPEDLEFELALRLDGFGSFDFHGLCTTPSWESTGFWIFDQIAKSQALVTWAGSNFAPLAIWLPSFTEAVLDLWPGIIDGLLSDWLARPNATIYAIVWEPWGWNLIKLQLDPFFLCATHFVSASDLPSQASYLVARAFHVSIRIRCVETYQDTQADAPIGTLKRVFQILDLDLGLPSCLCDSLCAISVPDPCRRNTEGLSVSPTLSWTSCFEDPDQMPLSPTGGPASPQGLPAGFILDFARALVSSAPMTITADQINVIVPQEDPSSCGFLTRDFVPHSQPIFLFFLCNKHWTFLHCTLHESELHIVQFDGLGLTPLCKIRPVADLLKKHWNVQSVILSNKFVAQQSRSDSCGTLALAHFAYALDLISLEQIDHFEKLHDSFVLSSRCRFQVGPIGFGKDADAITKTLEKILHEKGVPQSELANRIQSAIKAFGVSAIAKALDAKTPWPALKTLGNSRPKPFLWVSHQELQAHIQERSRKEYGVDIKKPRKNKENKQAESSLLDSAALTLPADLFVTNSGQSLQQLSLAQVQKDACGVAFATAAEAAPFLAQGKLISPEGLSLLVIGSLAGYQSALPMNSLRVPAIYKGTNEPVLVDVTTVQLGDMAVYRKTCDDTPEVTVHPNVVVRAHVFRDLWSDNQDWIEFTAHPIRHIVDAFPVLQLCREEECTNCPKYHPSIEESGIESGLLDVWGFRWTKYDGSKSKPADSEVLSVYLRIPESSFNVLHCASGIFGTFFEPRGQDNPGPDTRYSVVWAPKLSLGEAQHLVKTDDACIAVCRLGHKIGLRCWAKNYESLHQQVCPEKPFVNCNVKTVYRIEPLPAGTQRQSLVDILKSFKWIAKPLAPCRGSQGRAWQIGSETSPPCAFLETKSGWVSITKVKDQGVPAKTTDLIATARTRQHIQGQTNASASSSSTSDPWTVGHDPWGGYAGVGKSAIAPPSQHVQSKFDDVEQRLQSQVTESIAKGLEQIQSEPSNRMQTVEAQLQALAQQQHYLDNRLTADSAKIQEIQSNCSELAAAVQTCTTTLADQGTALQSIATEVSTQGRSLKQVSSEVASVSQNLTSQLDSYFSRQSEQIEALLAKRQRSTWLAPRGPLFGLARAPRAHANCPWIFRLILVWLFTCFLRVGEAAVPGPPDVEDPPVWALPGQPSFSISIGNPGGLCNKLHHLQSYPEGWHHFAETHCSASQLHHVQAHLRAVSVQSGRLLRSTSGAPAPLRAGSSFAGSWTGVLAFGDCPLRNIPLDWPSDLYKSGRVMVSSAFVNGLELIAGTVYCPPRGPTHPRAREQSEELLRPLTENIVLGRSGPRFILGDMNCPAGSLDQMKLWESLGWVELQSFMQDRFQVTPQSTCKSSTSPDQVWLSPEATLLVANSSVWHVYADHSVVLAGLSLPRVSINEPQWWLPGHVPWEHITQDLWTHELSDIGLMFPTTLVPVGGSDLSSSDVAAEGQLEASKAFHCWSQKFEKRVNRCASTHIAQHDRSFHGRGSMTAPRQRKKCPPVQKSSRPGEVSQLNGFLNRAVGRWFRQLRRLQSYKHAAGSVNAETNFESRIALWHSIRTAPGFQGGFDSWWLTRPVQSQGVPTTLPITAPNHRVAVLLYDEFLLNYRKFELWQLSRRNESCKHKLQSSVRGLFAATRKPAKEALDCLEDSLSQEITVVDTADNLVAVPHPFPPNNLFAWTLQQQPVQVRPMNGLYQIDTDLVLCSGQTLSCQVLVHETTEIHQRLANLWSPRWNRHHEIPLHRWDEIVDFAEAHLPRAELTLPAITAQDWHRAVGAFKSNAATGPCGWTLADLKNLTPTQVEAVLDAFQKIEEGAPWPLQWNVGLVHCLQKKADRHSVSGFRPITVMSLFYRIWAGIRSGQILAFLAGLSDTYQTGFLQHRQSADIWYFVNICLEVSMQQDWPVHGVVADLVAAYNLLPRHPAFRFLQILGVPRWFIQVWSRHLETFQRFFVVRRHAGPSLGSCTGFAEGCPLSCSAMTAFDCAWHVFQRHTSPRALPLSYVDNLELLCDRLPDLDVAVAGLEHFCQLLDLQIDPSSFFAWSTSPQGRKALQLKGYTISLSARDLGGQVTYCHQLRNHVLTDRIQATLPYFKKLRKACIPCATKQMNVRQVLFPRALHGCEAVVIADGHLQKLRSGVMQGLTWDQAGTSPVIRITLLHTDLDPAWYQLRQTVHSFRKQCNANHIIRDWWQLHCEHFSGTLSHGPFGKVRSLLEGIGLQLDGHGRLWFSDRGFIQVFTCISAVLDQVLEHFFHQRFASQAGQRQGFTDLAGVDVELTKSADGRYSFGEITQLMMVRAGTFFTDFHKSHFDSRVSAWCQLCQVPDTLQHRYTECSKYDHVRVRHRELFASWQDLPSSFTLHGLVPSNPWTELVWTAFESLPSRVEDFAHQPSGQCLHIFTDGTCDHPTSLKDALAAWAVHADGFGTISCGPVPGLQQTILRAELFGLLSAILWIATWVGHAHVWIDNQTVVDHLRALLRTRSLEATWEHLDLWKQIQDTLERFQGILTVHKVASHMSEHDTDSPLEDFARRGNQCADTQAGITNLSRPFWFDRVWHQFQTYRKSWKHRVHLLTKFQVEIAAVDCEKSDPQLSEEEFDEVSRFDFDLEPNDAVVSVHLSQLGPNTFDSLDALSQRVGSRLVQWLVDQDSQAASKRLVSEIEIFIGFRLSQDGNPPLSVEDWSPGGFRVVTFAADFSFFKKVFHCLVNVGHFQWTRGQTNLVRAGVIPPQPAFQIGWPSDLQRNTLFALEQFVGGRIVTNSQGLSKPWPCQV